MYMYASATIMSSDWGWGTLSCCLFNKQLFVKIAGRHVLYEIPY